MPLKESVARTLKIPRQGLPPALSMGPTTQQFFVDGAQHEATDWKDANLPPDDMVDVVDPEMAFKSFDKIPKKRGPALTLVAIGALLLIGSMAWAMSFYVLNTGRAVRSWASEMVGTHKVASEAPPRATVDSKEAVPIAAAPTLPPRPIPTTADPFAEEPSVVAPASARTTGPANAAAAPKVPSDAVPTVAEPPVREHHRTHALKGYVWSSQAGALVPAHVDESGLGGPSVSTGAPQEPPSVETGPDSPERPAGP